MQIVDMRESIERCTESGWDAYDFLVNEAMDDPFIMSLRQMEGSFLYMKSLKKPFFKLESDQYVIKGVKGDAYFRVALHRDLVTKLEEIKQQINQWNAG